jgi:cation diffusion facilitator family transporter
MRAVLAALVVNVGIAVTKFAAFLVSGSSAMLAEAVHSMADSFNELLLLLGRDRSSRSATEEHPFGFGRESYFYGFIVAVMLFTLGAVFSVYDGVHKIMHPEPIRSPVVVFIVLGVSVVLESISLRTALQEVGRVRAVRTFRGLARFVRRTKAPELVVVLLEDMAALLGLIFAFTGVLISVLTKSGVWDGAGSVAIGVLLALAAGVVAVETKSLLIGESASAEMTGQIVAAVESGPEHFHVIHMRTTHMGPESILVAAKIGVPAGVSAPDLVAGIDSAERRIRACVPVATTIYLEPDLYRPAKYDKDDPSVRSVWRNRIRLPRGSSTPPRRPLRECRLGCRQRESDELGEESVGLLGEGWPGQVGLIDPQRQHADDGRPEIECDGGGVPWRGNPGVHAALHRSRGAREQDLLERHADLALVHHLVDAGMLLHPGRLRQDPCAQGESRVLMCGLGLIRGPDHLRMAAFHGRRDERITIRKVQVNRGGRYRHHTCDRAQ